MSKNNYRKQAEIVMSKPKMSNKNYRKQAQLVMSKHKMSKQISGASTTCHKQAQNVKK